MQAITFHAMSHDSSFRKTGRIHLLLVLMIAFPVTPRADVYKYVDPATGQVFYTDKPKHKGFRVIIRSQKKTSLRPGKPEQFDAMIRQVAGKHQLDPGLVHAVIRAESAYDPRAVSPKGAVGLMQLMPDTATRFGVRNREDPMENISGGVLYLKTLLARFNSDIRLAVAAYNAGENAVERYGNKVPPFPETQAYVDKVLAFYHD